MRGMDNNEILDKKECAAFWYCMSDEYGTVWLVLASDGFFPFDDCVSLAAASGVEAIVQPGGSVRDEDSIRKANESGIPMLFTGMRHFKH